MVRRRVVFVPLDQVPPCVLLGNRVYLGGDPTKPLQFDVAPADADVVSATIDAPNHRVRFVLEHRSFGQVDDGADDPPTFPGMLFPFPIDAFSLLGSPAKQTTWRVVFEERQNILYSTMHVVKVMRTGYPMRYIL